MDIQKNNILREISNDLGLTFETQDWGIINSDSKRVKEFIIYFKKLKEINIYVQYEFFELIIASYNEMLINNIDTKEVSDSFDSFLNSNIYKDSFESIINYWIKIKSPEFPIGFILNEKLINKNNLK
ncbi:hypothetical protein [Flavobacterium sp.]|uniref:hypothetical protein n=1 Tax=Flavobacterium sp. TaxID=239 RepID=UPI003D6BED83